MPKIYVVSLYELDTKSGRSGDDVLFHLPDKFQRVGREESEMALKRAGFVIRDRIDDHDDYAGPNG